MTEQELKLELGKIISQQQQWHDESQLKQQQWHDEYTQRDRHWFWQKGVWLFMAGVALATLFFKLN